MNSSRVYNGVEKGELTKMTKSQQGRRKIRKA